MKKVGKWFPARVLSAIGSIGYTPVSAILDIADNSISNGARKVDISLAISQEKDSEKGKRKKAVIDAFIIKDDGIGMDEETLDNALSLGSSDEYYPQGTLSKFGMGLKSSASFLGRRLEVLTRCQDGVLLKAILDYDQILEESQYVYELIQPLEEEVNEFNNFVGDPLKSGTFVKVSKINQKSMSSVAEILDGLQRKVGIIYYYYLVGEYGDYKLDFTINGLGAEPYDPLFTKEINEEGGNLDEFSWDGLHPKWITKLQSIQLDTEAECKAEVEITQLPHPPTVADNGIMTQKACRDKYMIGAGNYGFYIYRNGRLISWADSLEMVGQDQNLYSFRGRIFLTSDSDDILNIDVTKSRIHLSELAKSQLLSIVQEAKKKSIAAWDTAKKRLSQKMAQDPHDNINAELDKVGEIVEKDDTIDEQVASREEKETLQKRREGTVNKHKATKEESSRLSESGQRVQYVDALTNNQLWQRAHDPDHGLIVRVNRSHRLVREILDVQSQNAQLIKVMDILFFALARGEFSLLYKSEHDAEMAEKIIADYREYVGNDLSEIIKKINVSNVIDDGE